MTKGPAPICMGCTRFRRNAEAFACDAYPDGIPDAIIFNEHDHREAFEGDSPARVRVTFDRDLACRITHDWDVPLGGCGWRPVLVGEVVLEIKFNGVYPAWLQDLVHTFQLQAQSVSKYTLSLQAGTAAAGGMLAMVEGV